MSKHKCNTLENGVMVWEKVEARCTDTIRVMPYKPGTVYMFVKTSSASATFSVGVFFDTPEQLGDLIQILTQARTNMEV